jgi:hypothetical protein
MHTPCYNGSEKRCTFWKLSGSAPFKPIENTGCRSSPWSPPPMMASPSPLSFRACKKTSRRIRRPEALRYTVKPHLSRNNLQYTAKPVCCDKPHPSHTQTHTSLSLLSLSLSLSLSLCLCVLLLSCAHNNSAGYITAMKVLPVQIQHNVQESTRPPKTHHRYASLMDCAYMR